MKEPLERVLDFKRGDPELEAALARRFHSGRYVIDNDRQIMAKIYSDGSKREFPLEQAGPNGIHHASGGVCQYCREKK